MRIYLIFIGVMACGTPHHRPSTTDIPQLPIDAQTTELSPDVLVVTTEPFATNTLFVREASGNIIMVDSPMTTADSEKVIDWIEHKWSGHVHWAINSHWHPDASAGNAALRKRGARIYSNAQSAKRIKRDGQSLHASLLSYFERHHAPHASDMAATKLMTATTPITIDTAYILHLGNEPVTLIYPGPTHSRDSIGVFFPDRALLYGGCAVRSDGNIGNKKEASSEWALSLQAFQRLEPKLVIPGHGIRFDPAMIEESIDAAKKLAVPTS